VLRFSERLKLAASSLSRIARRAQKQPAQD
jgi:hypothetical protein